VPLPLARVGREIGVVLSGSNAAYASIALRRDVETLVREEDLVVIVDERLRGYYMVGVLRNVVRYEPFLRRGLHHVYVESPDALRSELVMPFTNARVEIYGAVCDEDAVDLCDGERFTANTYAPTPSSKVYKLEDASVLSEFLDIGKPISVGKHARSGWQLPLDASYVPYHIGVFGATGMGKSRLVMKLVSEIASRGYSIVVFDHSGKDYAPFAAKAGLPVIDARKVRIPATVFAAAVAEMMDVSSYHRDMVEVIAACYALRVYGEETPECNDIVGAALRRRVNPVLGKEAFLELLSIGLRSFNVRDATARKLKILASVNLPEDLFNTMPERRISPTDVVDLARKHGVVVVDLSTEQDIEVKRAIVSSVVEDVWKRIRKTMEPVNLGIAVDEAQNYACEYCGTSAKSLETVAREGRKWGFFLIVASQRITRDIRPGIRSNLGTVFFSKLQATGDLQELAGYLDLGGVNEASLAMLRRREFYVAGLMNPLRRPILITVEHVEGFSSGV
jgi:DNA helicase HerA-like ATPase